MLVHRSKHSINLFCKQPDHESPPHASYLRQKHGQSHDEVFRQFVFIIYLSLPLLCCQNLDDKTCKMKRGNNGCMF